MTTTLRMLPLTALHPDPGNPRDDETPDDEMVESVRELGILQALLVKTDGDGHLIIAGHRRWRAGVLAEVKTAPCLIVDGWSADRVLAAQIAENVHRLGLNPIEQAKALERLQKSAEVNQRTAAAMTGMTQGNVSRLLMLLRLTPQLQAKVASREMSIDQALGYNRAPSRQLATRGAIDPRYDELRDNVKALGVALVKGDDDALEEAAMAAFRVLSHWLPDETSGGDARADGPSSRAPTIRCAYCPKQLPVDHPATATERIRAQSRHLLESERCRLRHERATRKTSRS
ncbi:MAG: ParB/RepB/Spo0J family partition protein [Rhodospirillales bacterium]|nr:ParB/RepB/Spo0J family partition protein [Rhodospirillales bacterium]